MLAKKKKITKKEMEQDPLVTSYYNSMEFLEQHKTNILIAVAAVVGIALLAFWYTNKVDSDNLLAAEELSKTLPSYESGEYQVAINGTPGTNNGGLKQIVENYSGTEQGEIAKIYLANSYFYQNQFEDALAAYDSYNGSNPLFKAASLAGAGNCFEVQKNYADAASSFERASRVSKESASNSEYMLKAAQNYILADNKDKAKNILDEIKTEYKASKEARDLDRYYAQLSI